VVLPREKDVLNSPVPFAVATNEMHRECDYSILFAFSTRHPSEFQLLKDNKVENEILKEKHFYSEDYFDLPGCIQDPLPESMFKEIGQINHMTS
jgi:hypothetical protein